MRALEEDRYVRQTEGYLPTAAVAFVDEIFKANSAILNTLLTVLNERLFDNGSERVRVPLVCLVGGPFLPTMCPPFPAAWRSTHSRVLPQVGASNELPESEELDALYDRFLLRRQVAQVSPGGLDRLLAVAEPEGDGAAQARAAVQGLELPHDLFETVRCGRV